MNNLKPRYRVKRIQDLKAGEIVFDGTLCKVRKVLQVFDNQDQAADAMPLFDPSRYEDYDTVIRMVPASELDTKFR